MKAKNISDDTLCHTDDITALRISSDRRSVVSGQVGSSPAAFMWDSVTGEKQGRYKLPKGSRGIDAIALSKDGKFVDMTIITSTFSRLNPASWLEKLRETPTEHSTWLSLREMATTVL